MKCHPLSFSLPSNSCLRLIKIYYRLDIVVMPVILAPRRLRHKDHEFETSLDSLVRPCLKKTNKGKGG
jgi:hypothetical protein